MASFLSIIDDVQRLTSQIPELIDKLEIEQVNNHLILRQAMLEQLLVDVEHQSDHSRESFIKLLHEIAEQDAIDKQKCELLKEEYKVKLSNQYKNNIAIEQYKSNK